MSDSAQTHGQHAHEPAHHITSIPVYLIVFFALAIGTLLTWYASTIDLGMLNTPIALLIAVMKATLVVLFFMHVLHSSRLTWVVIVAAFLWLGVLFVLTFSDYLSRGWALY